MLYIIPTSNGAYDHQNSPIPFSNIPDSWLAIPIELEAITKNYLPFVKITTENGTISKVEDNVEAREASKTISIETQRMNKFTSLEGMCSGAIYYGVTIGTLHYNFTEKSQINLSEIAGWIRDGQTSFLYRADNELSQRVYTVDEMRAIITAKGEWKAVNTLYYELLKVWVNRETDETVLSAIHYGSILPNDLLIELSTKLASVGIDLAKYSSAFTA